VRRQVDFAYVPRCHWKNIADAVEVKDIRFKRIIRN
jgi:hypothetical protein